ncbi:hypothetical protein SAMN04487818_1229 [Actinokineospora terrae]|uniref:Uncharacterized protein n=2 Tax=Actinokineospora terrae TaxID=155974 RepID=A0A1H9XSV2_9PSEU|nr:hypothetical protein SAMN04487818_1229 [Actinokineospora terrae]
MHRTDNNLKALAQKYDILDPAQREQYLAEFTNDIEKMRTSMTSLNMAYLVINDSAASIALPSNASDRSAAQSWRERYKNRAHMFSGLLESFDEFLQEEGRLSQAWSLIKTAGSSQTFGYVNDDVLNEGENIGIVSCP